MKKLTALLLTILFALSACTAALAWSCPGCGTEGSGNFCSECGTKRPEETICPNCGTNFGDAKPNYCTECGTRLADAASTPTLPTFLRTPAPQPTDAPTKAYLATSSVGVNIVSIEDLENGFVTVTWVDLNSNGPYTAKFVENTTGDFNTDRGSNLISVEADELTGSSYTYRYLAPGTSYWLTITNADGAGVYFAHTVPAAEPFADFTLTPSVQPILRATSGSAVSNMNVSAFSAVEIGMNLCTHGLAVRLDFPHLDSRAEYTAQLVITEPNGTHLVEYSGTFPFESYEKGGHYDWDFYSLEWYFAALTHVYDTVPTGEYTMALYLDGKLAAEATFTVTE